MAMGDIRQRVLSLCLGAYVAVFFTALAYGVFSLMAAVQAGLCALATDYLRAGDLVCAALAAACVVAGLVLFVVLAGGAVVAGGLGLAFFCPPVMAVALLIGLVRSHGLACGVVYMLLIVALVVVCCLLPVYAHTVRKEGVADSFFAQCEEVGRQLLSRGWLDLDAVQALDGAAIVGLPAVVLFRSLERSAGDQGLVLADGSKVLPFDLGESSAVDFLLRPVVGVRDRVRELGLCAAERLYVEDRLVRGSGAACPAGLDEARTADIHALAARVTGLALDVTRLDLFKSRTRRVFEALEGVELEDRTPFL